VGFEVSMIEVHISLAKYFSLADASLDTDEFEKKFNAYPKLSPNIAVIILVFKNEQDAIWFQLRYL